MFCKTNPVVVISPLRSLMENQVADLGTPGVSTMAIKDEDPKLVQQVVERFYPVLAYTNSVTLLFQAI